ncbi:MAG: hypothetical protein JNL57_01370 [Bacteroidetes bacterium]|nr:hypothetical protein [Bacteroidota bacterium]
MITRRLVRVKTLQALYSWAQNQGETTVQCRHDLRDAMLRTYEAYLLMLELPFALNDYLISEKEAEASKYFPDKEKIRSLQLLAKNTAAQTLQEKIQPFKRKLLALDWPQLADHFGDLYTALLSQEFCQDYLVFEDPLHSQQQQFLLDFYEWLFESYEPFHLLMEENYTAWSDDENLLGREVKKTLQSMKNAETVVLSQPDSQGSEDVQFGLKLYDRVTSESEDYESRIAGITENWDPGRIAIIDLLCIKMALAEFMHFAEIPVKVSINEYLDIIKNYSTPNSSRFVNGVLDKLRIRMEENGSIQKAGRGLRDS